MIVSWVHAAININTSPAHRQRKRTGTSAHRAHSTSTRSATAPLHSAHARGAATGLKAARIPLSCRSEAESALAAHALRRFSDDSPCRLELLLTIGMMSRITLSLREREHKPIGASEGTDDYEPDYDEDEEEEYARIRWQTSSFSSARSRGKRPDTQFLSLSALGTIDSEPVYFPRGFHAAEVREILELRRLDQVAGRTASGVDL
ncbi:hypothetical protein FIBSPDRAFT_1050901 [Athelia psychrophila]|uniref:Uncharacterized protein n=1 Tax=Athelia psychrophila TaxID=1759441 RepID=A0A166A2B8_9AGAM|nr:hypothetical protein FIBSPDRAFT_1050901 [Fibularhizoctonia sp. CBS 109695]